MINRTRCMFYEVNGKYYKDLHEAQTEDLLLLIPKVWDVPESQPLDKETSRKLLADWLLKNSDAIVDILTTTPKSRLRGRKSHGAIKKKRKTNELEKTNPVPA